MAPPHRRQNRKREILFDQDARRQYLCGFSDRKRQRRAYGLAMQKCKDRKEKLHDRKEARQAELETIEEAERLKGRSHELETINDHVEDTVESTTTFQDVKTQQQFGGAVVVTTTFVPLDDESDNEIKPEPRKSVDTEQLYAGNVGKFMNELKHKMPGKKNNRGLGHKRRGKHGAATMKGMGDGSDVKTAKRTLSRVHAEHTGGRGRRKQKRTKKKR